MSCFDVKIAKAGRRLQGYTGLIGGRLNGRISLVCSTAPLDYEPFVLKDGKVLYTADGKQFCVRKK